MFRFVNKNRSFGFRVALVLGVAFATVLGATPAQAYTAVARTTYVVQVKTGASAAVRAVIGKLGETPHDELTEVMDGFVLDMTDIEAATLRSDANVVQVVADQSVSLLDTQTPTPSWGLDRIDQTNTTYDNTYNYNSTAGAGVRVYVVDTGVMASDPDFTGRVETGVDLLGQNLQGADCQGHGTHVAGTIAGTKYGVAKKATIVPIRVLGCTGSGSMSTIISAVDWIIANHPAGTPAVMSASIGGSKYQLVNDAIEKLYQFGITPVIAAGNNNLDAAGYSPASAPNAITVGASDSTDTRASFSNFGDLVDVFAPGLNIVSDNYLDPTTPRTLSGTSMATPHVSGLAALYLADHKTATPAEVTAAIKAGAQAGVIVDAKSANGNYLINNKFTNAALPPVGAPSNVVVSGITATAATVTWSAPTGTQAANSYKVEYKDSTATTWTSVDSATTSTTLTALIANTTYSVRVTSIAGTTISPASPELIFSTLADVPDAPTNLRVNTSFGTQVNIAWDAPANANGSKVAAYEVSIDNGGTWTLKGTAYVTTYAVTGLQPNTTYSVRVTARNSIGVSVPSSPLSISTTAATPAVVIFSSLTNVTASSANISWRAVAPIDSATPITYSVDVKVPSTGALVANYKTSALNQTMTGLARYTYYVVVVTAYSGTIAGPASSNYTFRTLADVPTAVTNLSAAKLSATQTTLSWQPPRDGGGVAVTQFKIEKLVSGVWTLVATNDVTVQSLVVDSPAPGAQDTYQVSAVNSIGTGPAVSLVITGTLTAPAAPTGLTISPSGSSLIGILGWLAPTANGGAAITGYNIFRSADGGTTWTNLANAITTLTYNVALPPKGATYQFAVVAVNSAGASPKSTAVSYVSAVSAPGGVATPTLSWNTDGTLLVQWSAPTDNGGSPITAYKVQRLVGTTWTLVATVSATATTTNLARDAVGTSYSINVIAVNAVGDSAPSNTATIVVPAAKSTAPLNLASTSSATSLTLTWQAPANNGGSAPSSYMVQASSNAGAAWSNVAQVSVLTVTIALPPKGSTYQYRVYAITSAGNSDYSNVISVSSQKTKPNAPTMRSIGFNADGSLGVSWYAPGDNGGAAITGYRVEYSTNGTTFATLSTVAANVLSITIAREAPGVRAYVRVYSINEIGESAAGSTLSLATAALKASAPQNFTAVDGTSAVATAWQAPANLGGSTTVTYTVQVSKDAGATWLTAAIVSTLNANVARPSKGTTWQYRVVANTAAGLSDYSSVVSVTVAATAASAPTWAFVGFNGNGSIDLRWFAPADNGGSAIAGYVVEKSYDLNTWTAINGSSSATNTSLNIPRENPGVRIYFRVAARNATTTSAYSAVANLLMPYLKASAPQGFSATDNATAVVAAWTAPTNLGGSATVSYSVSASKDNGATWSNIGNTTATTLNVARPPKGSTWLYRVVATTAFGLSDYSSSVSIAVAATAPSTPNFASIALNTATSNIEVRWYASSDNGGSPITSYVVQKSADGINFATVISGTALNGSTGREAPGVRSYWRIAAINAVGTSAWSAVASITMPYVQASAVQNFTATDNGSFVAMSWAAPADLGGSPSIYYYIQYSSNGGASWLTYVSTSALSYNVARPAKGTTNQYRVVAVTAFGVGQLGQSISVTAAATAPSVPSIRSFALNPDLTSTLVFNAPTDLGGSPLQGYVVEQSTNGINWSTVSTSAAAGQPVSIAAQAPGVRIFVRVSAVNAIGTSAPSSVYAVQMPYVQASAVQSLSVVALPTQSYISLNWVAPSNLGGVSAVSGYQIQATADGNTWSTLTSTGGISINIIRPAKGLTLTYRVLAITSWGLGLPSNTVSASTPTTVTSMVNGVVATKQTDGSFVISFSNPTDLGGYSTWNYRVQQLVNNTWTTIQTGAGSSLVTVRVPSPAVNAYAYYRIISNNTIGDSSPFTLGIRG